MICSITTVALRSTSSFWLRSLWPLFFPILNALSQRSFRSAFNSLSTCGWDMKCKIYENTNSSFLCGYGAQLTMSVLITALTTNCRNRTSSGCVGKRMFRRSLQGGLISSSQERSRLFCSATLLSLYFFAMGTPSFTSCALDTPT